MTTDPPAPGTPWALHCPDAYPFEWSEALGLSTFPPGFARYATDDEAALITGKVPYAVPPRRRVSPSPPPPRGGKGVRAKRSDVRERFRDLSAFIRGPHRDLTPTARAVWFCVYTFTQDGRAIVTQAKMAEYGGVSVRSVKSAVKALVKCGLLEVLERGRPGRSSVYRYRVCRTA